MRFDVLADSGCGKTLLLNEVASALKRRNHLTLFITAQASDYGDASPLGRLMADQANCQRLVSAMADDIARACESDGPDAPLLDPAFGRRLEDRVLASRRAHQQVPVNVITNIGLTVTDSREVAVTDSAGAVVNLQLDEERYIRNSLAAMSLELTDALREAAKRHPLSILVDDMQTITSTVVGSWLLQVLAQMRPALVVHARRPVPGQRIEAAGMQRVTLGAMTEAETTAYVLHELGRAGWSSTNAMECARIVLAATRGHPIGVATCSQIITGGSLPPDAPPRRVREAILGGGEQWGQSGAISAVREFVDTSAGNLVGRPVRIFDLLVVMRRCTLPVLGRVLAHGGLDEHQAARIYDWLSGLSFITRFDDDMEQGWRLHDYIRENAEKLLQQTQPASYQLLHRPVEQYYREVLNFDQKLDEASAHASGSRYENPDWQRDSHEWLHHAAHLAGVDFTAAKHALIRLFLDAFWWWDAEVPSAYSPQLIASYRALPGHLDLEWVVWLEQLLRGYVPGTEQSYGRDRKRWTQAEDALARLCNSLELRRGRIPEDRDLRRIYILVCCLRGNTMWFSSGGTQQDREAASEWLRAAASACTDPEDHWIGSWAIWIEATLWVDVDPARARGLVTGLEQRIDEDEDNELRALLTQTYGDLTWAEGDKSLAFDIYARAVLHMWVYNVRQEIAQQTPNTYTLGQYRKVCHHVRQRFQEAHGQPELVQAAQSRMRAYFTPYWDHVGTEPDHPAGFPPEPRTEDLWRLETAFTGDVLWVINHMEQQLGAALEAPLDVWP